MARDFPVWEKNHVILPFSFQRSTNCKEMLTKKLKVIESSDFLLCDFDVAMTFNVADRKPHYKWKIVSKNLEK